MLANKTSTDYSVVDSARKLALAEHASQLYGNGFPYSYHLVAVTGVVSAYTMDPDVIAAAWLHDIVEDCESIDLDIVEKMTNRRVRGIVDLLSDPPGPRSLAKQVSLKRVASDPDATLVKLADRFCNVRATIMGGQARYAKMYLAEHEEFCMTMLNGFGAVWDHHPLMTELIAMRGQLVALTR